MTYISIPDARERLFELSVEHDIPELAVIAGGLHRRPAVRRAPSISDPITPAVRASIRKYANTFPDAPLATIAHLHNVNPGRVSEILNSTPEPIP
jgi:hypothetical protein